MLQQAVNVITIVLQTSFSTGGCGLLRFYQLCLEAPASLHSTHYITVFFRFIWILTFIVITDTDIMIAVVNTVELITS
jgi:hypothetical protein